MRRRNALAHLAPSRSDTPAQPPLAGIEGSAENRLDSATQDEPAVSPDIENMLNWVSNRDFDAWSVSLFVTRLADQPSLELYAAAMSLLRDRLRAHWKNGPASE
jgi:hypothetical protein